MLSADGAYLSQAELSKRLDVSEMTHLPACAAALRAAASCGLCPAVFA